MSLKIISIILMVVLRFQNLEEITCVERIAFIENEIVSNKSLCFDDFNQPDLYFPKKQVTIQLSNTLDSLTQIQNNNWFIDSKHIIYKVTYSSKKCVLIANSEPIRSIDRYFLWVSLGVIQGFFMLLIWHKYVL
jgi:hypothetical protein